MLRRASFSFSFRKKTLFWSVRVNKVIQNFDVVVVVLKLGLEPHPQQEGDFGRQAEKELYEKALFNISRVIRKARLLMDKLSAAAEKLLHLHTNSAGTAQKTNLF